MTAGPPPDRAGVGGVSPEVFAALNSSVRPLVKMGWGSPLPVGYGLVVLGTTGRLTGIVREVPLVAARLGDLTMVSTVRSDSLWLANLEADPAAVLWQWGRPHNVTAAVSRGPLNTVLLRPARAPGPGV